MRPRLNPLVGAVIRRWVQHSHGAELLGHRDPDDDDLCRRYVAASGCGRGYAGALHISTSFLRLAGASRIGVPRNDARAGPLVLLESASAERFGKIERIPA